MIVVPSRSLRSTSSSITSTWWRRSRWTVGSSRTRIGAAWATAMASRTSCRSPSDSSRASRPSRWPTPTRSIAAATAARSAGRTPRIGSSWGSRPSATTSSTRVANGRLASPGTTARRRATSRRSSPSTGSPASAHAPGHRPQQPGRDRQQGRLAGAVRADERDPLAGPDRRGRRPRGPAVRDTRR